MVFEEVPFSATTSPSTSVPLSAVAPLSAVIPPVVPGFENCTSSFSSSELSAVSGCAEDDCTGDGCTGDDCTSEGTSFCVPQPADIIAIITIIASIAHIFFISLILCMPFGHFAFPTAVVIFLSWDSSVASLFSNMRDLLSSMSSGRFAFPTAVVIFHFRNVSVALQERQHEEKIRHTKEMPFRSAFSLT